MKRYRVLRILAIVLYMLVLFVPVTLIVLGYREATTSGVLDLNAGVPHFLVAAASAFVLLLAAQVLLAFVDIARASQRTALAMERLAGRRQAQPQARTQRRQEQGFRDSIRQGVDQDGFGNN